VNDSSPKVPAPASSASLLDRRGEADVEGLSASLIAFFRALPPAVRREYDALAAVDRERGEDVGESGKDEGRGGRRDP